jgi:hypothetical protein
MVTKTRGFVEEHSDELFLILVVILIALISFGIGRLSTTGQGSAGHLQIESTPVTAEEFVEAARGVADGTYGAGERAVTGAIVGNKNSGVFHLEHCTGARTMSEQNKVYFSSVQAALDAGYRPAGNCPGL